MHSALFNADIHIKSWYSKLNFCRDQSKSNMDEIGPALQSWSATPKLVCALVGLNYKTCERIHWSSWA